MIELGVFKPGERIELIGGDLMVAEPQGAAHYTAIVKTATALEWAFGPGWEVRTQGPIGLDDDSEPEPDVAVVRGSPRDYVDAHPARPALSVEVAQSGLALARGRITTRLASHARRLDVSAETYRPSSRTDCPGWSGSARTEASTWTTT